MYQITSLMQCTDYCSAMHDNDIQLLHVFKITIFILYFVSLEPQGINWTKCTMNTINTIHRSSSKKINFIGMEPYNMTIGIHVKGPHIYFRTQTKVTNASIDIESQEQY